MYYVYVIRSEKDEKWYTGSTRDLRKRFNEHNSSKVFSTKNRGPFKLIYYEACLNEYDGKNRERYLKSGMGKRYLKNRLKRFLSLTGQKKQNIKAFTLVEMLVVVGIFTLAFGAIIAVLLSSGSAWSTGRIQQQLQREARKAISAITNDLRESMPDLVDINDVHHPITINANGDSITFYVYTYKCVDDTCNITCDGSPINCPPVGILYYLGAQNPNTQTLYRKLGTAASVAVATNINNITAEKPFFWFEPNTNNQIINIKMSIIIDNTTLTMTSKVTLRNAQPPTAPPAPEEPGQGEY